MPTLVKLSENRLGSKTITENGTYLSIDENLDGYAKVSVSVAGGGGGGSGLIEVSTAEEMDAVQTTANIGNVYKYIGETTDKYDNNALYILKQEGGNIALLTKDNINPDMGAPCQIYATPLQHPFVNGDKVDINFRVDGGEIQTITADYIEMDAGDGTVVQMIGDPNMDGMNILVQTDDLTVMYITYLNFNPFVENPDGSMGAGQVHAAMSQGSYIPDIEIVSFSKGAQEVINPVSQLFSAPYRTLSPITSYPEPATSKDIRDGYAAYNDKGELIEGDLRNPARLETQEEIDAVLADSGHSGEVYQLNGSVEGYPYGLYKVEDKWVTNEDGSQTMYRYLKRLLELGDLGENQATPQDIFKGKIAYDSAGNDIIGEILSCKILTSLEEVEEMLPHSYAELSPFMVSGVEGYNRWSVYRGERNYGVQSEDGGVNTVLYADQLIGLDAIISGNASYYQLDHIKIRRHISRPYAFYQMTSIKTVEIIDGDSSAGSMYENLGISHHAFAYCEQLTKFIIRYYKQVIPLENADAFEITGISGGMGLSQKGYIYVPDALVEDYKVADNWSTYASRIKPLSELEE